MSAQKSINIAIILYCLTLCITNISAQGFFQRPHERRLVDLSSESSEEDFNRGHLQQHPWERHRGRHHHGRDYKNDLDFLNVLPTNRDSEYPGDNRPPYTFSHSTIRLHLPRLNVILGAEPAEQEPAHPWHLHEPRRRHRFHHHRWHAGIFQHDNDEFSGEDMQKGSDNGANMRGQVANTGNNNGKGEREWESVESLETNGSRQNEEETTQKHTRSTTTTISPITHKIMTSTEKSTTNIPEVYETTTTVFNSVAADATTTAEPNEVTYAIDIRGGFY